MLTVLLALKVLGGYAALSYVFGIWFWFYKGGKPTSGESFAWAFIWWLLSPVSIPPAVALGIAF